MQPSEDIAGARPLGFALQNWFPPGRTGRAVALSTGLRWVHFGVGPNRVRLAAFRVGVSYFVTPESCKEFIVALNAGLTTSSGVSPDNTQQRVKETSQALEALGC